MVPRSGEFQIPGANGKKPLESGIFWGDMTIITTCTLFYIEMIQSEMEWEITDFHLSFSITSNLHKMTFPHLLLPSEPVSQITPLAL